MGLATHALLCPLLAAVPGTAQTDAHLYSPGTNLERSELAQLETATRTLDVAMYSFTDQELAEELATLARRSPLSWTWPDFPQRRAAVLTRYVLWDVPSQRKLL